MQQWMNFVIFCKSHISSSATKGLFPLRAPYSVKLLLADLSFTLIQLMFASNSLAILTWF